MLASHGVFAEDDRGRFALTPVAAMLQMGSANSLRDFLRFFSGDIVWHAYRDLLHTVRTGEYGFAHAYGMGFFAYLAAHPDVGGLFSAGMAQVAEPENAAVVSAYDFGQFARLVDIGGDRGGLLAAVLTAFPTVHGVLHDWADAQSIQILQRCLEAMAREGRVLTIEGVIRPGNAPDPIKDIDVLVGMALTGGRERTEAEFRRLYEQASLQLTRVIPTPSMSAGPES
jgi:hypothetical protein